MRFAHVSLAAYFLLAFGLMGYGFSIDRIAGFIGALPGLVGLIGTMLWSASPEGIETQSAHDYLAGRRRIATYARNHAYSKTRVTR